MQKTFRFAGYFIYAVLMGFIIYTLIRYDQILLQHSKQTFDRYPHLIYVSVYPILIGFLFALPTFVKKLKTEGTWHFDWVKALAVGVPALFGSSLLLLYFSPLAHYIPAALFLYLGTDVSKISGIVLGYTILNGFEKRK